VGDLIVVECRVYHDVPSQEIHVDDGAGSGFKVRFKGFKDCTIWNPQEATGKGIADMEDGGWVSMSWLYPILESICLYRAWLCCRIQVSCTWRRIHRTTDHQRHLDGEKWKFDRGEGFRWINYKTCICRGDRFHKRI
jgi:hypothetical protein